MEGRWNVGDSQEGKKMEKKPILKIPKLEVKVVGHMRKELQTWKGTV